MSFHLVGLLLSFCPIDVINPFPTFLNFYTYKPIDFTDLFGMQNSAKNHVLATNKILQYLLGPSGQDKLFFRTVLLAQGQVLTTNISTPLMCIWIS